MTRPLDIAKLIEMRDHARGNESAWRSYELGLSDACDQVELAGGGLLERHAMLEELGDYAEHRAHCALMPGAGKPCDCGLDELRAALRASEAPVEGRNE